MMLKGTEVMMSTKTGIVEIVSCHCELSCSFRVVEVMAFRKDKDG